MENDPGASKLTVQIWSDVICPFCPIGDRRLRQALSEYPGRDQVKIVYRSYRLGPGAAPHSIDDYLAHKYGADKVAAIQAQVTQMAAQEGLIYRLDGTVGGDTLHAHRLLHFAATVGKQEMLVARLYRGYFSEHANLFDHRTLLRLAVEVGIDESQAAMVLDSDRFTAEVEADQAEAHKRGIRSVPHFLINDRISFSGSRSAPEFLAALNSV